MQTHDDAIDPSTQYYSVADEVSAYDYKEMYEKTLELNLESMRVQTQMTNIIMQQMEDIDFLLYQLSLIEDYQDSDKIKEIRNRYFG